MAALELTFDRDAHSADAIQRAAYRFCDRLTMDLKRTADSFLCVLTLRDGVDVAEMERNFKIEVLDQTLRERVREETSAIRNAVLALAFSQLEPEDGQ